MTMLNLLIFSCVLLTFIQGYEFSASGNVEWSGSTRGVAPPSSSRASTVESPLFISRGRRTSELITSVPVKSTSAHDSISDGAELTVVWVFLAFLVFVLAVAIIDAIRGERKKRARANQNQQQADLQNVQEIIIDDEFIETIPKRRYTTHEGHPVDCDLFGKDDGDRNADQRARPPHNTECPICLDEFAYGNLVNQLHCWHCFHPHCITPWLKDRSTECPLCKMDVRLTKEAIEREYIQSVISRGTAQRDPKPGDVIIEIDREKFVK